MRRPAFVLALVVCTLAVAPAAYAQLSVSIQDVNPDSSTLDPSDPDGASGGRVNGLATARSAPGTFYAASEWGGLFKSTDGGQRWAHLDGHVPTVTWDVEVDPANANRVYATSFFDGRVTSRAGINVSTDAGVTWTHPATATPPANFCINETRRTEPSAFGIAIDPANASRVFVGTSCGLATSTDNGGTWTYVDPTPADRAGRVWDVIVHNGGIIDVCGDDGHLRSTNGGTTWTTATTQPLQSGRCSLAVSPDESYVIFAAVGTSIFESDDGGQSWPVSYANPSPQGRIPFLATNNRAGADFDLWFGDVRLWRGTCTTPSPANPGGAQRCQASGTWAGPFTRSAGAHDDSGDIQFANGASDACPTLFSSDGGVFRNTLAASPACHTPVWDQPIVTPHALWNFTMTGVRRAGDAAEDLYMGNQDNGTFGTTTGGGNAPIAWTNERCCDGFDTAGEGTRGLTTVCCFSPGRATRLFVSGAGLTGASPEVNTYPAGNMRSFEHLEAMTNIGPDDYIVATTSGVFVTQDIGASPIVWTQLGAATSPATACGLSKSASGATPVFFVKNGGCSGDAQGQLFRFDGTAPGGAWQQVPRPFGTGGVGVYAVHPTDPERIIASHLGGPGGPQMVMTRDGGATWVHIPALDALMAGGGTFLYQTVSGPSAFTGFNGYPQPTLVAFDPTDPDIVVAGAADSGVFISTNGGTKWQLVTDPNTPGTSGVPHIPRPFYAHFDHDPAGGNINLFLGTRGRGVWRLTFKKVLMPEIQIPGPPLFEDTCLGGAATGTLHVCNTSAGDLIVSSITSSNPEFSVVEPTGHFPVAISHDFCFPFQVTFTPTAAGTRTADLVVSSNDPNTPTVHVEAEASVGTPDIRVTGSTNFGVTSAWSRAEKTVRVCNTGTCGLQVTNASISCSDFALVNSAVPATLPEGACLDLVVEFTPTAQGRRTCQLTIASNDPDTPIVTRDLIARTPPALSIHMGLGEAHGSLRNTVEHGMTFDVGFLNPWSETLAFELRVSRTQLDGKTASDPDVTAWMMAPEAKYLFNPTAPFRVFVNGGPGLYHLDPGHFEFGFPLGAGVNWRAGRRIAFEGTYNFNWLVTASPSANYSQIQAGMIVSF